MKWKNKKEQGPLGPTLFFRQRNFTMLEMVMVVLLVSVLFGMALLSMDSFIPSARLSKHMQKMSNIVELAFFKSAVSGEPVELVIHRDTKTIELRRHKEADTDYRDLYKSEDAGIFITDNTNKEDLLYDYEWDNNIELVEYVVDIAPTKDEEANARDFLIFMPEGYCDTGRMTWKETVSGLTQTFEIYSLLGKIEMGPVLEISGGDGL